MKSDFMVKTAKIIAEVRTVTFIDSYDAGRIEEILQNELKEYYECYALGYSEGRAEGYDLGYNDGHSDGYYEGYSEGHSEVNTLVRMSLK